MSDPVFPLLEAEPALADLSDQEDRFVLRPDGAVWFYLNGVEYRTRRPRLRDDSAMWELFLATSDELLETADKNREWAITHNEKLVAEERAETAKEKAEGRKKVVVFQHLTETKWIAWYHAFLDRMADPAAGEVFKWYADDGDVPMWMTNAQSAVRIINHWRSTPVPSSAR